MKNILKLVGIGLLAWILSTIDLREAWLVLLGLHPGWLAAYALAFTSLVLTRVARLGVCLRRMGRCLPFAERYIATLEPALLGTVTPGRLGEFARAGYLAGRGIPLAEALMLCLLERLVDFGVLCVLGLAGCAYIFGPAGTRRPLAFAILLVLPVACLAVSLGFGKRLLSGGLSRAAMRFLPARFLAHGIALAESFQRIFQQTLGVHLLFSCAGLSLCLLQIFCLAEAFSLVADRFVVLFSYAASTLISLLPISFAGLGTRDATYIYIMCREGILREQALLFSLLDGVVVPVCGLVLLLLPCYAARMLRAQRP